MLARQIGHREWISVLLHNLGETTRKQGNYSQSELYLQEGLTLARQLGIPQITANTLYEYGNLCLDRQQPETAESTFHEMLTVIPEGSQDLIALAQYGLARSVSAQGNIDEARRLGEASLTALDVMGHRKADEVSAWLNSMTN